MYFLCYINNRLAELLYLGTKAETGTLNNIIVQLSSLLFIYILFYIIN